MTHDRFAPAAPAVPLDPFVAASLDEIHRRVGHVVALLETAAARAPAVAAATDWQSPTARAFHDRAERWRRDLVARVGDGEDARDAVRRCRSQLEARAAGGA